MAKGIFATAVFLSGLLLSSSAEARPKSITPSGCAALADSVRSAVLAASRHSLRGDATPHSDGIPAAQLARQPATTCGTTTRVTTEAFSSAFAGLGIPVHWDEPAPNWPMNPGDYCASHDLSECYPGSALTIGFSAATTRSMIHDTWKAVRIGVTGFMPYGSASDWSSFDQTVLATALQDSIRQFVEVHEVPVAVPQQQRWDKALTGSDK